MRKSILILTSILAILPVAFAQQWACSFGDPPYVPIEVTIHYINKDAQSNTEVFAVTPQRHPIIYPDSNLAIQLRSDTCEEFTLSLKSPEGAEVGRYTAKPYSPHPNCIFPPEGPVSGAKHLTLFTIQTPDKASLYALEIIDATGLLLVQGNIKVRDPATTVPSVSRSAYCSIDSKSYTISLDASYPIVVEQGTPGTISVLVTGADLSAVNAVFDELSVSFSPHERAQVQLAKIGSPVCPSSSECRQDYQVASTASTSGIAYVSTPSVQVNSQVVAILDISKMREVKANLEELSSIALQWAQYYSSIGDSQKASVWQAAYDKLSAILAEVNSVLPAMESRDFKIADVVELIRLADEAPSQIDRTIESVSGI
jgi:hypothetical protein